MMWSGHMFGWGGFWMGVAMLAFWVFVVAVVVLIARSAWPREAPPKSAGTSRSDAETILAERFARGEIDADEYHSRLHDLRVPAAH